MHSFFYRIVSLFHTGGDIDKVRVVKATTGIITTFVGYAYSPYRVTLDVSGNECTNNNTSPQQQPINITSVGLNILTNSIFRHFVKSPSTEPS